MQVKQVLVNRFNDTFTFGNPTKIDFLIDSTLIVYDDSRGDDLCYIFTNEERLLKSFGHMGRGRGELILPIRAPVSQNSNHSYIYDFMPMKYLISATAYILNDKISPSEYNLKPLANHLGQDGVCFQQILNIGEDKFIAFGNTNQSRI